MAFETYGGVSRPLAVIGSDGKLGYGSNVVSGGTVTVAHGFDYLATDDIVVVAIASSVALAVNAVSLSIANVDAIAWNRLLSVEDKLQVFIGHLSDDFVDAGDLTVPWAAGGDIVVTMSLMRNVSGIDATSTTGKSIASPWAITSKPTAYAHACILQLNNAIGGSVETGAQYSPYALPIVSSTGGTVTGSTNLYEVDAKNVTASFSVPTAGGLTGYSAMVTFYGPTVDLDDLTFRLTETGTLLNADTGLPLYDVSQVTGLFDSKAQSSSSNIDGTDGSYVNAKYMDGKTVILDGTLYAATPVDETLLDDLVLSAAPTPVPIPFFFKLPNHDPRHLMVYPLSFTSQMDRNRALGTIPFELQMQSESAVAFDETTGASVTGDGVSLTTSVTIDVDGNAETYPRIYFSIGNSTKIEIDNPTWRALKANAIDPRIALSTQQKVGPLIVVGDGVTLPGDQYGQCMLDLKTRRLFQLDTDTGSWVEISSSIKTRQWFSLIPNVPNKITMTRTGGADAPNFGFSVAYENAWR